MDVTDKRATGASAATPSHLQNDTTQPSNILSPVSAVSFLFLAAVVAGIIWHDLRTDYQDTLAYWNVQLASSTDNWVRVSTLWLNERRTDTFVVAESPGAVHLLSTGTSGGNAPATRQVLERDIKRIAEGNGFLGGAVGGLDCRIAAQYGVQPPMAQGVQEACRKVQEAGEYQIGSFGMEQGHVWISLSAPVIAVSRASSSTQVSRRIVGSVVMVAEPWQSILNAFVPENLPSRTDAGLIVWKKASEAFIFSPLLSTRGEKAFFRRPLAGSSFESRVAMNGDVPFGEFSDYRGKRIFGVARRMGAPGYSLARKIDRDEALSQYRRRQALDWLVGALSLLFLGSVMVAQHRNTVARDLQERVRQQEALRESDRRYRVLFESAGDGIVLISGSHFVDCNQKALELFGCRREQLIGNTLSTFSPPRQPDGALSGEAALEKEGLAREGQTVHFEWQHLRLDGTTFQAEVTLSPLEIAGMPHLLALIRDVSDRKRAQEALQQSDQRYKDFISHSNEGVWRTEMEPPIPVDQPEEQVIEGILQNGTFAECNLGFARNWGFSSPDEVVGKRLRDLISPSDHGRLESYRSAFRGGLQSRTVEFRGLDRGGNLKYALRTEIPIVQNGMLVRVWGITRDITELRQAEEALRESEARLRLVVSQLPAVVWTTDRELRFTSHLGAGLRALGLESNQLVGKSVEEYVLNHGPQPGRPDPRRALEGESLSYGVVLDNRDYDVHVEPLRNAAGEITGTVGIALDVTARRQAEAALRESEERFRATFENAGVGMALVDLEGHPIKSNPALRQLLGYSEEELSRMAFTEFTHPDDRELDWGLYSELTAGKRDKYEIEKRYLKKDGGVVWGLLNVSLVKGSHGRPAYAVGMVQDITERKRAEEELRDREERFRMVFEGGPIGMSIIGLDGRILRANEALCNMYGYTEEELGRLKISDYTHPEDKARHAELSGRALKGEIPGFRLAKRVIRKDGKVIWTDLAGSVVRAADGTPLYGLGMVKDITESKRMEEALRQSDQRYKDFISHSNEGVWRVEFEQPIPTDLPIEEVLTRVFEGGYLAECNVAFARIVGFSTPEELIGKRPNDLIIILGQERPVSNRPTAPGEFRGQTVEIRCRDKAGNTKHLLRTQIPIIENGMLVRAWGMLRDVTQQKRAEEELQRSFDQLRALAARLQSIREEERKRVAREIHDQLGQALTAIKIDLSSLVRDLPADKKQGSDSVLNLIDQTIQSVRKISTDLRPGILDDLGLVAAVEWAGEEFQARTGTTCRLDLPSDDLAVDPERATAIFRIFQETLTNVARHADAKRVGVRLFREDGDLILEVHDDGKGIPADKLASGESLGILGMRERTMLLGGELTITGPPGLGTTVSVRIPAPGTNLPESSK